MACAIQNIQLAAWAEGLGMQWSTGKVAAAGGDLPAARHRAGRRKKCIGLLFFGYPAEVPPPAPRKPLGGSLAALALKSGRGYPRYTLWPFPWRTISRTSSARPSAALASPIPRSPPKPGLPVETIQRLRAGRFRCRGRGACSPPALGLNPHGAGRYRREGLGAARDRGISTGLAQFNTPFGDMTVNAYLVWDEETKEAAAFDTGADVERHARRPAPARSHAQVHPDHPHPRRSRLRSRPAAREDRRTGLRLLPRAAGRRGGDRARHASLRSAACASAPGSPGGTPRAGSPIVVQGLRAAGGGGGRCPLRRLAWAAASVSYADALRTNRAEIFSLPDETIVCPGHGPMTTVGEEKAHNPFFATLNPNEPERHASPSSEWAAWARTWRAACKTQGWPVTAVYDAAPRRRRSSGRGAGLRRARRSSAASPPPRTSSSPSSRTMRRCTPFSSRMRPAC